MSCFSHIIQYRRTAFHAAYWTKNNVIMNTLVDANATNVEAVQAVNHDVIRRS